MQTKKLKEEMELLYKDHRRSNDELKKMIQSMAEESADTVEQRQRDLELLKGYLVQANRNKERQQAYEIEQIIGAIEASKEDEAVTATASMSIQLEEIIRCPISKQIMLDPVLLKDSCITYDRSSIAEWFRLRNRRDPMTMFKLSAELLSNLALRSIARLVSGKESESLQSCDDEAPARLSPGMCEGYRIYKLSRSVVRHHFLVLVLEPAGNVLGCTIPRNPEEEPYGQNIFKGEWQPNSRNLNFIDECYLNECIVTVDHASCGTAFRLIGKATPYTKAVQLETFDFEYEQMTVCAPMYHPIPIPGLLEMEGKSDRSDVQHKQKVVVIIDDIFTFKRWFCSIDQSNDEVNYGRIYSGNMKTSKTLHSNCSFQLMKAKAIYLDDSSSTVVSIKQENQEGYRVISSTESCDPSLNLCRLVLIYYLIEPCSSLQSFVRHQGKYHKR